MDIAAIQATGLKRYYQRGSETVKALDGIDVVIRQGEIVAILGPSGSGKSTLVNVISCLEAPTAGSLSILGKSTTGLSEDQLVEVRRGVFGFVFQQFHLLPTLTVTENVELPLLFLGKKPDSQKTQELLRLVGLAERSKHLPKELSGGQMQRVAIARALIVDPRIVIADEPTGNLDKANGEAVFSLFLTLAHEQKISIIITTHNLALGYRADRVLSIEDGKIIKEEKTAKS